MTKELTGQEDKCPGLELAAENCEDACRYDHRRTTWLESEDKFFCNDCMIDFWAEEILLIIPCSDCELIACSDEDEEFTHFTYEASGADFDITLKELEALRASIKSGETNND